MATRQRVTSVNRRIANMITQTARVEGPDIARDLRNVWNAESKKLTAGRVAQAIESGRLSNVGNAYVDFVNNKLAPIWLNTASRGANIMDEHLGVMVGSEKYIQEQYIDRWIMTRGNLLTEGFSDQQQSAVNSMIQYLHVQEGLTPAEVARELVGVTGLTERESLAVQNRRAALLEQGVSKRQVGQITRRYRERLELSRANRIARTEIATATNEGIVAAAKQKEFDSGKVGRKYVIAYPDCCDFCRAIELAQPVEGIGLNEDWREGSPPFHPNCRCVISIDFVSI